MFVDPQYLNLAMKIEFYEIPTTEQLTDKLSGKKYFLESSDLCAFFTPWRCYKFLQLACVMLRLPENFQDLNERVFEDIAGGVLYFGNIFLLVKHDQIIAQVLQETRISNLTQSNFNTMYQSSASMYFNK
ncbi:hypothetical protein PR048_008122 [Dryococelus australis]|uniref:Uncharacterized protein n=1 Tax=Dryococelus australis TaxID=614101 RepID=A0ABQ9HW76_9NEOP|nr:hypothetical protein PR048_008122 [Dryococelus australis]